MTPVSNLAMRDIETLIHPYTNLARHRQTGPFIIEEGRGIYVRDHAGKEYIEGLAGLWCTSLGYGNEELAEAAYSQMRKLGFTHLFAHKSHDLAIELAEELKVIAPCEASKILFCCSGSEANDMQVKLTWYYNNARGLTKKKKIIARHQGYHGVTVAAGSLTGLPVVHRDFDLPIANILHVSCPHFAAFGRDGETEEEFSERLADELRDTIEREGPDTVAAFIAEPVMGAGGVITPPKGYFRAIQAVLDCYDVRFISDEVICGFGRTGQWFGAQTLGMKPTSVSIAKALTSAYMPLGAVTVEEELYQAMLEQSEKIGMFGHGYTYTAHPVAVAVALKTLEIYKRDRLIEQAARMGAVFQKRLAALRDHPLIGETRGVGLIGACTLVADKMARKPFAADRLVGAKAAQFCQDRGLILRAIGDNLALCPPLIIREDEIGMLFDRLEQGLGDTLDWLTRARHT